MSSKCQNRDYRDFVLSRFRGIPELMDDPTDHGRESDPGWATSLPVIIEPDSRLKPEQRAIIEADYGMQDGRLVIETRGALVQYKKDISTAWRYWAFWIPRSRSIGS